jgi:hypothetical protein
LDRSILFERQRNFDCKGVGSNIYVNFALRIGVKDLCLIKNDYLEIVSNLYFIMCIIWIIYISLVDMRLTTRFYAQSYDVYGDWRQIAI